MEYQFSEAQKAELVNYWLYARELEKEADNSKYIFLSGVYEYLQNEIRNESKALFYYSIAEHYRNLAFFPNDETKQRLIEFGIPKSHHTCFIPIGFIHDLFERLNNMNVFIYRHSALKFIKDILDLNINILFLGLSGQATNYDRKEDNNSLRIAILNHFRRRKETQGLRSPSQDLFKTKFDKLIFDLEDRINEMENRKISEQELKKLCLGMCENGNMNFHLHSLVTTCFIAMDDISQAKISGEIYELIRLLLLNSEKHKLPTEEEFYAESSENILENSFATYKAKRIHTLFFQKRKR